MSFSVTVAVVTGTGGGSGFFLLLLSEQAVKAARHISSRTAPRTLTEANSRELKDPQLFLDVVPDGFVSRQP